MSLIIAHTQKNPNRKYSRITRHMSDFLYTHGINWEWLWKIINTHTNSQGGFKGMNSVTGFLKKNMEKTNLSTHLPFFFFHTEICCDFDEFVIVFVFYEPAESRGGGGRGTTRCRRLPVTKRSLRGVDQPSVEVCWWSRVRLAPPAVTSRLDFNGWWNLDSRCAGRQKKFQVPLPDYSALKSKVFQLCCSVCAVI